MRRARLVVVGTAFIIAAGVLAGCGSSSKTDSTASTTTAPSGGVTVPNATTGTTINVTVSDTAGLDGKMTLVVSSATAPAGDVTFVVKNTGTIDHEMVVLKTDLAFDKLPVTYAGDPPAKVTAGGDKVGEDGNVGETGEPDVKPGGTRTFTIKDMKAGSYALVCNIAKHYPLGMRAAFTVT
jgi:uncharacterized cupredoxin-like copper-binding protein